MSPLLERYRRSEGPERQGSFLDSESADPQSVAAQVAYHTQLFSRPIVCDDAVSSVRATATELGANGAEVLVVAMPVSDDMAALHPEGRAGHRSIADRYREAAGAAGAGFVDLTGVLGAEHFHDPAHPNQAGRAIITEQVLAQLT